MADVRAKKQPYHPATLTVDGFSDEDHHKSIVNQGDRSILQSIAKLSSAPPYFRGQDDAGTAHNQNRE
jgi:hypothetical protein